MHARVRRDQAAAESRAACPMPGGDPAGDVRSASRPAPASSIELNAYWKLRPQKNRPAASVADAAHLARPAVVTEDGQVDPVEDLPEAGRPHDVDDLARRAVDDAAVRRGPPRSAS